VQAETPPSLQLDIARLDEVGAVVDVAGEIDLANRDQLAALLNGLIDAGHTNPILDVSGVQFLGADGLNELVAAANRGAHVTVVNVPRFVRHELEVAGMDVVLTIEPTSQGIHPTARTQPPSASSRPAG